MGFNSFTSMISKNLRIIFRSKISTIFILLLPLIAIILMGYTLSSTGVDRINVGIVSLQQEGLSEVGILEKIQEKGFETKKFQNIESCKEEIRSSKIHLCILFPSDFSANGSLENVTIYVDSSKNNIAYLILNEIESKFSESSSEIGLIQISDLSKSLKEISLSLEFQKENLKELLKEIDNLGEGINSFSSPPSLTSSINSLKSIKNSLEDTSDKEKIDNIIKNIETIEAYYSSNKIGTLERSLIEIKFSVEKSIKDLDSLIEKSNSLSLLDANNIISPINTNIESINLDKENFNFVIPTAIALVALFGGILISAGLTLRERKTKAYFRNFMTPATNFTFLLGDYITCMMILFFQFILVFLALEFLFNISLIHLWKEISLILFLAFSVFTFIGTFIGYTFKSEETITFASVIIATIFVMFSNILLPVESFLNSFSQIIQFNPLMVLDSALRKIILFDYGMINLFQEIYILLGIAIIFFFLSWLGRIFTKRIL